MKSTQPYREIFFVENMEMLRTTLLVISFFRLLWYISALRPSCTLNSSEHRRHVTKKRKYTNRNWKTNFWAPWINPRRLQSTPRFSLNLLDESPLLCPSRRATQRLKPVYETKTLNNLCKNTGAYNCDSRPLHPPLHLPLAHTQWTTRVVLGCIRRQFKKTRY